MSESKEVTVVIPVSGEVLPLNAPNKVLAEAAAYLGEIKSEAARVEAVLTVELAARMDKDNVRKVEEEGFKLAVGPPKKEWDLPALDLVLAEFVTEGRITQAARERIIEIKTPEPYPQIAQRELKKLLDGDLPETAKKRLKKCARPSATVRKAKVTDERKKAA